MREEALIEWLYRLLDCELGKPEEAADQDLIAECLDYLEELQTGDNILSPAEIQSRLAKIKTRVERERNS